MDVFSQVLHTYNIMRHVDGRWTNLWVKTGHYLPLLTFLCCCLARRKLSIFIDLFMVDPQVLIEFEPKPQRELSACLFLRLLCGGCYWSRLLFNGNDFIVMVLSREAEGSSVVSGIIIPF